MSKSWFRINNSANLSWWNLQKWIELFIIIYSHYLVKPYEQNRKQRASGKPNGSVGQIRGETGAVISALERTEGRKRFGG
jgi:membrane protein implicated in regulation of membrane protease activity